MTADSFAPRWAASPSEILRFWLAARGLGPRDLADRTGRSESWAEDLLGGTIDIDVDTAYLIAEATSTTPSFWEAAETQFETDQENVTLDTWCEHMPIKHMSAMGWIPQADSWYDSARSALDFFGVASVAEWNSYYGALISNARLRSERPGQTRTPELATWMRACELFAPEVSESYSEDRLRGALEEVRSCVTWPDPARFVPHIQRTLGRAGVRLAIVRAAPASFLSGAAWHDASGSPIIGLTARGLTDDRVWFSLYPEAAHILLDPEAAAPFVDELDSSTVAGTSSFQDSDDPTSEREADTLAVEYLLDDIAKLLDLQGSTLGVREIVRLAAANNTSPGVVVGQLQHLGILEFSRRNSLKRRYQWSGSILGKR